jgi:hypothetical protein
MDSVTIPRKDVYNNKRSVSSYLTSFFDINIVTYFMTIALMVILFFNLTWSLTYYYNKYDKNSEGLIFTIFNFIGLVTITYIFFYYLNSPEYEYFKSDDKYIKRNKTRVKQEIDNFTHLRYFRNTLNRFFEKEKEKIKDKGANQDAVAYRDNIKTLITDALTPIFNDKLENLKYNYTKGGGVTADFKFTRHSSTGKENYDFLDGPLKDQVFDAIVNYKLDSKYTLPLEKISGSFVNAMKTIDEHLIKTDDIKISIIPKMYIEPVKKLANNTYFSISDRLVDPGYVF